MVKLIFSLFVAVFLSACSEMSSVDGSDSYNAEAPVLMHHSEDTKGRSAFPSRRAATGRKVFIFDPKSTAWAAYDASGERVKTGRASGGSNYCPDIGRKCRTVRGQFAVQVKKGPGCVSKKFPLGRGGAPMPHCMFFHKGYAIHGSYHVPNYNASHGCIRVLPSAAKWLSNEFMGIGTTVIVNSY